MTDTDQETRRRAEIFAEVRADCDNTSNLEVIVRLTELVLEARSARDYAARELDKALVEIKALRAAVERLASELSERSKG